MAAVRWKIGARTKGSLLVFGCILHLLARVRLAEAADLGCSNVKYAFETKGFNSGTVPRQPVPGHHLRICQQGQTCCTEEMEDSLNQQSRQEFDRIVKETANLLKNTFAVRAHKFDEFFRELLKNSKQEFHSMFVRTYGTLYEQNSHVFTDLFDSLEKYYISGNINLMDALDSFFSNLYQKMFQVLNAQYTYDEKFLTCLQDWMDELQPFGDVPQKLSMQVKRAFVAARTFVQGLAVGRDVIRNMMDVPPSAECSRALMKMTYCPHCQGLPDLKPCNNYCLNVMKGCLAYHAELNIEWNNYIGSLINVSDRLQGPFNIESVVEPINIKISDAIMNFQENGPQVSKRIFDNCGKPRLGKREVARELEYDTLKFGRGESLPPRNTAAGTSLDRLVKDINSKIKVAINYWSLLPYQVCNNEHLAAKALTEDNCWNGNGKAKYESQIMGDGIENQAHNPEVNMDVHKPNSILNQQILSLRLITGKLRNAFSGQDVDWPDNADFYGSGSGSGDEGSGVDPKIETTTDEAVDPDFPFTTSTMKPVVIKHLEPTRPTTSSAPVPPRMTLRKAIDVFVLPIMIMWLGSMF